MASSVRPPSRACGRISRRRRSRRKNGLACKDRNTRAHFCDESQRNPPRHATGLSLPPDGGDRACIGAGVPKADILPGLQSAPTGHARTSATSWGRCSQGMLIESTSGISSNASRLLMLDGKWGKAGMLSYALGFLAVIPFFSGPRYVGSIEGALGKADISFIVGLLVSTLLRRHDAPTRLCW